MHDPTRNAEPTAKNAADKWATIDSALQQAGGPTPEGEPTLAPGEAPSHVGRYHLRRLLGRGSFGEVYEAQDEELNRAVALKLATLAMGAERVDAYLDEARIVAGLDHPHIVPVFDVGHTEDGRVYVVTKLIDGSDLADRLRAGRPQFREAAELIAVLADALRYAHVRGLVHRDIKPGNILLDREGRAYLCDFGLALREEEYGRGPTLAGTPAYMSPEQARGEGHRVDGRSDIYSLGVVLYELLTGRRPFDCDDLYELLRRVAHDEPRPPRQLDPAIPPELERITLKCMAHRAGDRYTAAADLEDDLRAFLGGGGVEMRPAARVVPKGLRSYDSADSDFFLSLLPGPRDRDGLPDSIGVWKRRLEERDTNEMCGVGNGGGGVCGVGLIYGPSGCGKSSLVKAGLLPRLAEQIRPLYVVATAEETEARLLAGLRRVCPELPAELSLPAALARIRLGESTRASRKVVLIIDQFEQWLHARHEYAGSELADALRQCDGGTVQAVLMVRDDFWMATSRLFRELDIPLIEGQNCAAVDLFDPLHARRVLEEFGRAYGRLPERPATPSSDQERFLEEAATGLATDGKVIPVRLALFAEMVKGRPWTPATLRALGGISGVGVAFLDETFGVGAPPARRRLQDAARAVLRALLPEARGGLKGHRRSQAELFALADLAGERDFAELLRFLDTELRLITPTDPELVDTSLAAEPCYQLTHDYLVPALREWLSRAQRETRRGRAELRLAELSADWTARPERRRLPTLREWLRILCLTRRRSWTGPQRAMMRGAGRLYLVRIAVALVALLVLTAGLRELNGRVEARRLVETLLAAKEDAVPGVVEQLRPYRSWAHPLLSRQLSIAPGTPADARRQLHVRLALLAVEEGHRAALHEAMLDPGTPFAEVRLLRDSLASQPPAGVDAAAIAFDTLESLRGTLRDTQSPTGRRFRAGLALARHDPSSDRWSLEDRSFLAEQLVAANPDDQPLLRDDLRPLAPQLLDPLESLFADARRSEPQRLGAANALADFGRDDGDRLARLLCLANPDQFQVVFPRLVALGESVGRELLREVAAHGPTDSLSAEARVALGARRAGAAIALLRRGEPTRALAALRFDDDPEAVSQFAARCRAREVRTDELLACLEEADRQRVAVAGARREVEDRVVFALLLALGEYSLDELPASRREPLIDQVAAWYADDPSAAVHGASGWLLRGWGREDLASHVDRTPLPYSPDRQWFNVVLPTTESDSAVAPIQLTFVVIPPGEYRIGSPADERDREDDETRRTIRLTRPFAMLDREITRAEFESAGLSRLSGVTADDATGALAATGVCWYDAVRFCRWLSERAGRSEDEQAYGDPEAAELRAEAADPSQEAAGAPRNWPVAIDRPGFRLPTEAEWETACRAGTRGAWSFGGDVELLERYAWYERNSGQRPRPPRTRRPDHRGLFDGYGNAAEWCHDWYESPAPDFLADPIGPESGSYRVHRGGGWVDPVRFCRSAHRSGHVPSHRRNNLGLRIAVTLIGE